MTPHLYSRFHPDLFMFGGDITEKPLHNPQSEWNIGSEPIIKSYDSNNNCTSIKIILVK